MMRLRNGIVVLGLTLAVVLGLGQPASAADMPVKAVRAPMPAMSWTGFYLGIHAGYGWADTDARLDPLPTPPAFGIDPVALGLEGDGFVGGAHIGYNWQLAPAWLVGVEADWSWSDLSDFRRAPISAFGGGLVPPARTDIGRDVNWLASIRARLGVLAAPSLLIYATGGIAWGDIDYHGYFQNNVSTAWPLASFSQTETGYVIGGGVEWALAANWLLRGEYLHYRFDGASAQTAVPANPDFPVRWTWDDTTVNIVRLGLSYKF